MDTDGDLEILLVAPPGLEAVLCEEAREKGFRNATTIAGGVTVTGGWPEVWRANLQLRGASRVLARVAVFRAMHLAQLDKRARRVAWREVLRPDVPFRVEATCRESRIYHSGAAAERIERAVREELGAPASPEAEVAIKARIEDDLVTISVDTSGESLHKRGHKEAVAKAPMRETLAALFLRQCGYDGREPVVDPMCGSGTFVIEAAEIAAGLEPGRSRRFAFEALATFDAAAWDQLRSPHGAERNPRPADAHSPAGPDSADAPSGLRGLCFHGYDRDAGAIAMAQSNAARAGVAAWTTFRQQPISDLEAPSGPPGLVMVNPPYGARMGEQKSLRPLYSALGHVLMARFLGWRVGLVTSESRLAHATGLSFAPPSAPVSHGGLRVHLFRTGPLA